MIRALVVEDSPVEQELITHILNSDTQIQVVGVANDGEKALSAVERLKPDVITMDIHMPKLNGFDTTRRIMENNPVPIVIVSGSFINSDLDKTFHAIEAGALAIVRKPRGIGHPEHLADVSELTRTVKTMSEVKVVRRWPRVRTAVSPLPLLREEMASRAPADIQVVAIGASTGGPIALRELFAALPENLNAPVLVVQHMSAGFMEGFVTWLSATSGFPAQVATHGEQLMPGHAYFAPDGFHMLVDGNHRIRLSDEAPENGLRPAVAHLFRSVAEVFGNHALAVLLTGMGKDGANELQMLKTKGAITVVQDRETSIVYGMPGEALKLNAAKFVLAPERIAELLAQLTTSPKPSR